MFECVQGKITTAQNESLMTPIEDSEVKKVLFDMHPDKASGLHGMNSHSFRTFGT